MTRKKRAMQFSEYLWKNNNKKTHKFIVSNTKHIKKKEKKIVYGSRK